MPRRSEHDVSASVGVSTLALGDILEAAQDMSCHPSAFLFTEARLVLTFGGSSIPSASSALLMVIKLV